RANDQSFDVRLDIVSSLEAMFVLFLSRTQHSDIFVIKISVTKCACWDTMNFNNISPQFTKVWTQKLRIVWLCTVTNVLPHGLNFRESIKNAVE
ncbi:Hypothetical predicted protein, partial [Paramuricea clavata]